MKYKRRVLIIASDQEDRASLRGILEGGNYQVLEASNAQDGMKIFHTDCEDLSLLLMDSHMVWNGGPDFIHCIREDAILAAVPVVVLSGSGAIGDQEAAHCLSLGAADFIRKPYHPRLVLQRIRSAIKLKESSATLRAIEFDDLTLTYTRRAFYHYAELLLKAHPDERFDLIFSDVENFQRVNEMYGSNVGDQVLHIIGSSLAAKASDKIICGRYGSDQFVMLYHYDEDIVTKSLKPIWGQTKHRLPVRDLVMKFGIYENVDHDLPVSLSCDRALCALRTIKHQYGQDFAVYDEEMRRKNEVEFQIESEMERALDEGQFSVYYQPKHDLKLDATCGAEALVRWIHPVMGFMSPGDFIPVFERNGFIKQLDIFVLDTVCITLSKWIREGAPVIPVSVNISRRSFEDPELVDCIKGIVDRCGIDHSLVHIEVTESCYTENPKQVSQMIRALHEDGFIIELDDFGTGYSSLTSLNSMDLDILKMDMSMIQQDVPGAERSVLELAMMLAKGMKLKTVQEGVETEAQLERVKGLDCDYVQGYYYSRPLPLKAFEEYVQKEVEG